MIYHFKMAAKLQIFTSRHFDFGENMKNHFPKGIFQWNFVHNRRLSIHLHNITEIKIGNFYSCWILGAKQFFANPPMLIYAN